VGVQPLAFQKGLSCIKLFGLTKISKEFSKSEGVRIILGHGDANLLQQRATPVIVGWCAGRT
jgi:hypothetical protein